MKRDDCYVIYRMFKMEYRKAVEKHPRFCDRMIRNTLVFSNLQKIRENNDRYEKEHKSVGSDILCEEVAEAMEAYSNKDYDNCIVELVQCIVVIVRMIVFILEEKENGKEM